MQILKQYFLLFSQLYQQLLALSGSLEVPNSYGGNLSVNELRLQQAYSSFNAMPSTSSGAMPYQRPQVEYYY